jgi:hypothetical protein
VWERLLERVRRLRQICYVNNLEMVNIGFIGAGTISSKKNSNDKK